MVKKIQAGDATDIERLVRVMRRLRAPDGCPWDLEQTRESLKPMLVEEAYEVLTALDEDDPRELKEELGDLLLQIVFHAQIAEERGEFRMQDVIDAIHDKIVRRHPHIFGDVQVNSSREVLANWDAIKAEEHARKNKPRESLLDGISPSLPALYEAHQLGVRASRTGFDWEDVGGVLAKIREELAELEARLPGRDPAAIREEAGDILFAVVNLCRFLTVDPETALKRTNAKFRRRFRFIEERLKQDGKRFADCTLDELEQYWQESKPWAS
jgi:tetrapyrrole methylase family protein/MazG family protein